MARPSDLVDRYHNGATLRELATDYAVSHTTVKRWLMADGVELRNRGRSAVTGRKLAQLIQLHTAGHSATEIARMLGLSRGRVVLRALERAGIHTEEEET